MINCNISDLPASGVMWSLIVFVFCMAACFIVWLISKGDKKK